MEQSDLPDEPRINTVVLGLGSNQGDRVRYLERALGALIMEIKLEKVSSIYETEPMGLREQPLFLNLVCIGVTRLKPAGLLEFIQRVEKSLGRVRRERFGPRTIDVDILTYEDQVIEKPDLEVPHPRMAERAFVLQPLAEVAPEWRHPVSGKTAKELLKDLEAQAIRPCSFPAPSSGAGPLL